MFVLGIGCRQQVKRSETPAQVAATRTPDLHDSHLKRLTGRRRTASGKRHSDQLGVFLALC